MKKKKTHSTSIATRDFLNQVNSRNTKKRKTDFPNTGNQTRKGYSGIWKYNQALLIVPCFVFITGTVLFSIIIRETCSVSIKEFRTYILTPQCGEKEMFLI